MPKTGSWSGSRGSGYSKGRSKGVDFGAFGVPSPEAPSAVGNVGSLGVAASRGYDKGSSTYGGGVSSVGFGVTGSRGVSKSARGDFDFQGPGDVASAVPGLAVPVARSKVSKVGVGTPQLTPTGRKPAVATDRPQRAQPGVQLTAKQLEEMERRRRQAAMAQRGTILTQMLGNMGSTGEKLGK